MEALVATIDDPSNGIGFELVTHHQFDKYKFSLHATDVSTINSIHTHIYAASRSRMCTLLKRTGIFVSWCLPSGVTNIVLYSETTATQILPLLCQTRFTFACMPLLQVFSIRVEPPERWISSRKSTEMI